MALKKSDLYSSLWKSCDQLRGNMDASQYKDYILTLLFVKYVSDKAKHDPYSVIEVPADGSFDFLVNLKGSTEIGDKTNKAIAALAKANNLVGIIDNADFNDKTKLGDGREMQDRLSSLIGIFQGMSFAHSRAQGDDLLGDAYEYLMRHFATQSGKSKGQFYTPAEVSRVIAQIIGVHPHMPSSTTVYDPTCGSGSLLIKVADAADKKVTVYGQEKDNSTYSLAAMNMILHGYETADIRLGDSLSNPQFTTDGQLNRYDFVVANPPFSVKSWTHGLVNEYDRFEGFTRPPEQNGDYAFLLHIVKSLKPTGKAVVILPHGVLFRGNAEANIRRELIDRGYIKAIIGLPANLFYGTGIPACIIVIDKENAPTRTGIFMIDASQGYIKNGNKNRLRSRDIHQIVDAYSQCKEIPRYSRMVSYSEICNETNDYNLNIPRYIDTSELEDIHDLDAHIHGGIPDSDLDQLQNFWEAFPTIRSTLFKPIRTGYSELAISEDEIQTAILEAPGFQALTTQVQNSISSWFHAHVDKFTNITKETRSHELITHISEDLLHRLDGISLLDPYSAYEHVMTYWDEVMHDDVFMIIHHGWSTAAQPQEIVAGDTKTLAHLTVGAGKKAVKYSMDLLPPEIIARTYYSDTLEHIDSLALQAEELDQRIQEFTEEHGGEDGLLADTIVDNKISKTTTTDRLKKLTKENGDPDEIQALTELAQLYKKHTSINTKIKQTRNELDATIFLHYQTLTETDIHTLVLYHKWLHTIIENVTDELRTLTYHIVERIQQLAHRYANTVEELTAQVAALEKQVSHHLAAMGIEL